MGFINDFRNVSRMALMVAFAAAMVGIIYGYDQSNIAGALHFMQAQDVFGLGQVLPECANGACEKLTSTALERQGLTASMVVIGMLFGALFGGPLSNKIGRKPAMIGVAVTFALFSVFSGVAWSFEALLVARTLLGLTVGVSLVVVPVFVAESAPTKVRGAMLVLYQFATVFGIICGYLVAWSLAGTQSWRLMLALAAVPSLIVAVLLLRIPETARFLIMQGRVDEARKVLVALDPDVDADAEIASVQTALTSEDGESGGASVGKLLGEMVRKPYLRATLFVIGIGFFIQATGINAIVYYTPKIFESMGYSGNNSALFGLPAIVQVAGLVAVFASMSRVDRGGRRQVLLFGIAAMIVASAMMIITFGLGGEPVTSPGLQALGIAGLILFTAGFSFGFGSVVWIYAGESFPARLRALGASLLLTADLVANFIIGYIFPTMLAVLHAAGSFAVLGGVAVLAFFFSLKFAPETKGRGLDEIRHYWENGGKWPDETGVKNG